MEPYRKKRIGKLLRLMARSPYMALFTYDPIDIGELEILADTVEAEEPKEKPLWEELYDSLKGCEEVLLKGFENGTDADRKVIRKPLATVLLAYDAVVFMQEVQYWADRMTHEDDN
jgi:hypothetical protein